MLDGDPTPPPRKRDKSSPPLFGPCLLWPNGRPSQQLLRSCAKWIHTAFLITLHTVITSWWGEASSPRGRAAIMRHRIAQRYFFGWGLVNQSAVTHCLLSGCRPVYLKMPVGERWSGCRRLVYGSHRVSQQNYTKVALPLSVIPHVLSRLIWPSGRLHHSRQTRAKTLRHLGRDSSALGARQFGT